MSSIAAHKENMSPVRRSPARRSPARQRRRSLGKVTLFPSSYLCPNANRLVSGELSQDGVTISTKEGGKSPPGSPSETPLSSRSKHPCAIRCSAYCAVFRILYW